MTENSDANATSIETYPVSYRDVFRAFLQLGLTSFGGPIAHLGFFREAIVRKRGWLDERSYADLVALCQFLPGPASSQVGIGIGLMKAGLPGAFAAWLAFTTPSAIALILFGYGVVTFNEIIPPGVLHGLKVVAVAVVAQAVWGMAQNLCPDWQRRALALAAAGVLIVMPTTLTQIAVIIGGGLFGFLLLQAKTEDTSVAFAIPIGRTGAIFSLSVFFILLIGIPLLASTSSSQTLAMIDGFYRAGSLVFGGGHVVLPLLQAEVVPQGWMTNDTFLAGYGAAQAVPGPLFTFAAYLGAVLNDAPNGWLGGVICVLAIFAPSFLLVTGALPFWAQLRHLPSMQNALLGINAAVVGLLLAAFYSPVWTSGILALKDLVLAAIAFILLQFVKVPPWLVVILTACGGWINASYWP